MQAGFATPVMCMSLRSNSEVTAPFIYAATYSWLELVETRDGLIVSAHFSDPTGILYVKPGEGDPSDVNLYADVIPLTAGSHLSAILSRRQRDVFSKNAQDLLGITTVGLLPLNFT
jgi:hypothetical protein